MLQNEPNKASLDSFEMLSVGLGFQSQGGREWYNHNPLLSPEVLLENLYVQALLFLPTML